MAVLFAVLSMLIYLCSLLCSHLAAFRVQANIRSKALHHIVVTLPMCFYTACINAVFAVMIAAALFFTADGVTNEFLENQLIS